MYAYDELDRTLLNERVSEFRDQVKRRLSGELTEDEFKMLRLQNGVYLQLHAYMFRVAIPYGTLSSNQLRRLAHVGGAAQQYLGHGQLQRDAAEENASQSARHDPRGFLRQELRRSCGERGWRDWGAVQFAAARKCLW